VDVLGHGLPAGILARLIRRRDVMSRAPTPLRTRMADVPAGRGLRASRPGWLRPGSCAGMPRNACGWHGNACRRAGPGQDACVGLNKTRSPPCMRCRGPCLASPPRSASCLAFPMLRAARQSQGPARGSGFPAPPTSRSCLRAVPASNGESISTASGRDRASPCRNISRVFRCAHSYPQNVTGYPHSTSVFHRLVHSLSTGYQA
jgi:hypothetical protein